MNAYIERCQWAAEILEPAAGDRILEIGCGHGTTAHMISNAAENISVTAIDRSEKMIEACKKKPHVTRTVTPPDFIHTKLNKADFPVGSFNKIFVFNMNVFWMDPIEELSIIKDLLAENGRFYLFHQPPPGHDPEEFAIAFQKNIEYNDFSVIGTRYKEFEPVGAVCLISVPKALNKKTESC